MRQFKIEKSLTRRNNRSLDLYFQELTKIPVIAADEEVELAGKIKNGDAQALEQLISANLRFVISVAKQYQNRGLSLSDLISEGNLGLIKAAHRFDETKGFKFISYAVWWIRQSILDALNRHSRLIRLPLNKIGSLNKIKNARSALEQVTEREPSVEELAAVLHIREKKLEDIINAPCYVSSLDAPLGGNEENSVLLDSIANQNIPVTDEKLIKESLSQTIDRALKILNRKESYILRKLYGINSNINISIEEIGKEFHLSNERVRQIKQNALKKLREGRFGSLFRGAREISGAIN